MILDAAQGGGILPRDLHHGSHFLSYQLLDLNLTCTSTPTTTNIWNCFGISHYMVLSTVGLKLAITPREIAIRPFMSLKKKKKKNTMT